MSFLKKNKQGLTIIEVLISITVMAIIGLGLLKLMSNARKTPAKAECRGMLRLNAQLAVKQLEKDIASSRALPVENDPTKFENTVEFKGDQTGVTMQSSKLDSDSGDNANVEPIKYFSGDSSDEDKLYNELEYSISDGKLTRTIKNGGSKKIADNIKFIGLATQSGELQDNYAYSGKVSFFVTAAAKPAGEKDEITYTEFSTVTIKQLQNKLKKDEKGSHFKQRVNRDDF